MIVNKVDCTFVKGFVIFVGKKQKTDLEMLVKLTTDFLALGGSHSNSKHRRDQQPQMIRLQ